MTNEEKLLKLVTERKALKARLSELGNDITDLTQKMIPDHAKFQIGQEVDGRHGKKYRISRIASSAPENYRGEHSLYFEYYGHEILKNGKLHKRESNLYWITWG